MQWLKDALDLLAPGWVGSIIGLIGIAVAALTYVLTRQRGLLAYRYVGKRLLGLSTDGLPKEITMQYQGQEIQRLTRTLMVFWNAGEKTVSAEDIVAIDPLRLKLGYDGRVLAATVLKQTREVNQVDALVDTLQQNEVGLRFAFLDSGDGALVEILHTSEERHAELLGTVRGLPHGLHDLGQIVGWRDMRILFPWLMSPRKFGWFVTLSGLIFAVAGPIMPGNIILKSATLYVSSKFVITIVGMLNTLLGLVLIFLTRRRYPKSLRMDELD